MNHLDLPPIFFYLPQKILPTEPLQCSSKFVPVNGPQNWVLQTYLRLKENGFPCHLVSEIPDQGIVICHRRSTDYSYRPNSKTLAICIKGDIASHPYTQIQVVQNRLECKLAPLAIQSISQDIYLLPGARYYMPHWPQANIQPRNDTKVEFMNIAYFGITFNLASELRSQTWTQEIEKLGLCWKRQTDPYYWSDYRTIDAIVAIRSFQVTNGYSWKPPSKLFNAWIANVPAILGPESAFQAERKSSLDYLEVKSVEETLSALKKLRDDPDFREAIVKNGQKRAQEIQPSKLVNRWRNFLIEACVPAYERWCGLSNWERKQYYWRRDLAVKLSSLYRKGVARLPSSHSNQA
jgi:hypothetical protein